MLIGDRRKSDSSVRGVAWREKGINARVNGPLLFFLFFVSGFCGLVYQVIWTRLAFASFGIITPVLSVILSVFMLGLSLGAWAGGRWVGQASRRFRLPAVSLYGLAELSIGIGALAVPRLFRWGERVLLPAGGMNSGGYLLASALVLAVVILPWCVGMGATFPLMMAHIRDREPEEAHSFSYLYLANVLGAMTGAALTALILVELLGFNRTLWLAAAGNFLICGICLTLGAREGSISNPENEQHRTAGNEPVTLNSARKRWIYWVLFSTGLISMAMEVVWTRAFAPVVKTQVYSFALIVATYLGATFFGSWLYRRRLAREWQSPNLIFALCLVALLPVLVNDPRWIHADWTGRPDFLSMVVLLASICPFCALLGFLTPSLVDECSAGAPALAGRAYALNVFGCIVGPLLASYVLLPWLSERYALVLLSLPLALLYFARGERRLSRRDWLRPAVGGALVLFAILFPRNYEEHLLRIDPHAEVRRDYAASVVSFTEESGAGAGKHLLVNGVGMTSLTPITKFMAHLPLALHQGKPTSALIICFGMGTTFRSTLSWGIPTTAVELIPSVPQAFGFYHTNADAVLRDPNGRIIIDDGRRFLSRCGEQFDVIVLDPPPPVEAAGSSLLYSREFYETAKRHLKPNGILQAWFPGSTGRSPVGRATTFQAVARSIHESFPYVRCYGSLSNWGRHLFASMQPIPALSSTELAARLPEKAQQDLLEWTSTTNCAAYLEKVVSREIPMERILEAQVGPQVTDDQPFNEYFLLREFRSRLTNVRSDASLR
jgi:spermidine synthase